MIWGVSFALVEEHLAGLGYRRVRSVMGTILFIKGSEVFTIREPNVNGSLPENLVNDAFDTAGLDVPDWPVGWVD